MPCIFFLASWSFLSYCPATATVYWLHYLVFSSFLILLMTSELKLFLFYLTQFHYSVQTQARWNNLAPCSTSHSFFVMALGFIRKFSKLTQPTDPAENFLFLMALFSEVN